MSQRRNDLKILILGAGMSGLLAAIRLKQSGFGNFEILEMADGVGGTWHYNTYPGLSCDVPAHNYDYSFEPNWKWSGLYATGPELKAYFQHCADKYGVMPHVRLRTRVVAIHREGERWRVRSADGQVRDCDVILNCMGFLCHPKVPDIPGLDDFAGARFHSARWNHSVPLDGRRIGVIGTGSTATQLTVALAPRSAHYILFQRTAQWVCPAFAVPRPWLLRLLHRTLPGFSRFVGSIQGWALEKVARGILGESPRTYRLVSRMCRRHLDSVRDPLLRAKLTPDYKPGCRRLILSDGFYEAIQLPQAEVVTEGIARIEAAGVRTRDGRLHELDVLVLATGFHALDYTHGFDVINEHGDRLSERLGDGGNAHRGVAVTGFPNYFMLVGPHSPVGNFAVTGVAESQMRYLLPLLDLLRSGQARTIDVRAEAQLAYGQWLESGFGKVTWTSGCKAGWYLNKDGKPLVYPFTPQIFRRDMHVPNLEEFAIC